MIRFARVLLLSLVLLLPQVVPAQTVSDREAVRLAVLDYVEGFYEGDTARLVRSVSPEVRKYGYYRAKPGGPYVGEAMPFPEFLSYANRIRTGRSRTPPNAVKDIVLFDVQDQTASAKLTAWWGTDYLLLARDKGRWIILQVLWQGPPAK
jgi:putative lumazine-binding protein